MRRLDEVRARMFADVGYLTTFADLALEELGKHVVGGNDDGEPWCAECVGSYPCPDAELKQKLEEL